jgi:hypothetical protein
MSPIGVAPQRPPLYPQLSGDAYGGGAGGGQSGFDHQQPQYYRPKQPHVDQYYGAGSAVDAGPRSDEFQHYQQQHYQQQPTGQDYFAAHPQQQPQGSGGYAYDSDAGLDYGHAQAMPKEEPPQISAGEAMDQAIDDIFSFARHNRVEEVERLLDRGVPVNVRDSSGNTILIIASQNGHKRVAKCALRRGADINAKNYKGNTPLHFCFTYGYGDTLGQYMISKGADPAIRNNTGLTCYEGLGR